MKADKVYLVGFMAAGKTTVAQALAKRLEWRAVDIDESIEARERMSVADIFARHGEPYFRMTERAVLTEQVFAIPGFGKLLVDGVFNRDYAVVQAVVLVSACLYVLLNLGADVLYFLANPRLRSSA